MKPSRATRRVLRNVCALSALLVSAGAFADSTIHYRVEGTCNGDFDEVQLKEHWLRADSSQDGYSSSMIYDGVEKLAYFVDHKAHTFMQVEMDEDAVDLQKDVMTSLGKNMKTRAGFDPFAMAGTLCPGLANEVDSRDRQPGEAVDCGAGSATGANGSAPNSGQMAAMMQKGQMPAMDSDTQAMMQKMMEQQMAQLSPEQQAQMKEMLGSAGASGMPGAAKAPSSTPQRIDRDAGETEIDGITCQRRQHLRGDTMLREDCYATVATLKLGDVETRRLAKFSKSIQEWSQAMTPPGMGKRDKVDDRVLLRRTCYEGGRENGRATLTIERTPIAESRFEVPAGYKPMDLGSGMQGVEGGRQGSR